MTQAAAPPLHLALTRTDPSPPGQLQEQTAVDNPHAEVEIPSNWLPELEALLEFSPSSLLTHNPNYTQSSFTSCTFPKTYLKSIHDSVPLCHYLTLRQFMPYLVSFSYLLLVHSAHSNQSDFLETQLYHISGLQLFLMS